MFAARKGVIVQMPHIGAGLAGGKWPIIEEMIERLARDYNVTVEVYSL